MLLLLVLILGHPEAQVGSHFDPKVFSHFLGIALGCSSAELQEHIASWLGRLLDRRPTCVLEVIYLVCDAF